MATKEWSNQTLTEQAVAQESATEALSDEMMRIRQDLALVMETQQKILEKLESFETREKTYNIHTGISS